MAMIRVCGFLVLVYPLARAFSLVGVGLAVTISSLLGTIMLYHRVKVLFSFRAFDLLIPLKDSFIATLIILPAMYFSKNFLVGNAITFFCCVFVFLLIYCVAVYILDRNIISEIKALLKG